MTAGRDVDRWVDLHSHVIPGVDDGAADPGAGRAAVEALAGDGVATIVATPHVNASLALQPRVLERRMDALDAGWHALESACDGRVRLVRGAEVMLDIPTPDLSDPRFRLGGGPAVLVEFGYMRVPPRSAQTLAALRRNGYLPVLAHPERYAGLDAGLRIVEAWLAAGAFLQMNAASLTGRYGREPRRVARVLLERGHVHCLASDYHARGEPGLAPVRSLLAAWGGEAQARRLLEENPSRLLRGEPCLPVAPVAPRKAWWSRLAGALATGRDRESPRESPP